MLQENQSNQVHEEAEERKSPTASIIHHTILKEAESELTRTSSSLFWSGLAAGLSMGISMLAEGLLISYLPEAKWVPLLSNFGYTVGFLIVILGKQQLFTENTLTPVLPLLHRKSARIFWNVLRLWGVVLAANLLGTFLFALVVTHTSVFDSHLLQVFADIGHKAMKPDFGTTFVSGIFAGWLIALMVWLLPYSESEKVWVIIIVTFIVGLGHFSHVIVGSVETFTLAAMGEASWLEVLGSYILPTLLGNITGGVIIVAALNHAQVRAGD
ncbi:formate/nitrite transporter family protein [Nafulsella turpanensis]|uniref:formate/nitrite transporter family protein n=1 Tax=Nafulsella turpanensis TaxID=1265690 RepID=UPI000347A2E7|nr:formate/nitrite transporter family protein [Nafulsella turpanensis]